MIKKFEYEDIENRSFTQVVASEVDGEKMKFLKILVINRNVTYRVDKGLSQVLETPNLIEAIDAYNDI